MAQASSRSTAASLALQQNNRGAFFIETQRFDNAISCLSLALQQSKQLLASTDKNQRREEQCSSLWMLDELMSRCHGGVDPMMMETDHHHDDDDDVDSSNDNFVYQRPISIPSKDFRNYVPDENDCNIIVSVSIIFNLALAHHLRAMKIEDPSGEDDQQEQDYTQREKAQVFKTQDLQRALRLYELAYKLQADGILGSGLSTFYVMSTLNNLGQIHKTLNQPEMATKCFENLLAAVMFLVEGGGELPEVEMDGFMRNVAPSILQTSKCAGAA